MKKQITFILFFFVSVLSVFSQRTNLKEFVTVRFVPNKADWVYKIGENVQLEVSIVKHYVPIPDLEMTYEWGMEMNKPEEVKTINTGKGTKTLNLKGSKVPGFKTCKVTAMVDGQKYSNYITVGFEPEKIQPTTELPDDFKQFWDKALKDARKVPLEPLMVLQPELCTPFANVYHIRFQNAKTGNYFYGMLSVPNKEGKFPAVIKVPGAGVRKYEGETDFFPQRDVVTLQIGIHGIPVNLPNQIYTDLRANALSAYNTYNNDDRDKYYYKKVYTGCVKSFDFLASLPFVDAERIGVFGGSQGGLLAVVVAALEPRIKCVSAIHPAMAEVAGFYHGRAGGWPKIFMDKNETNLAQKIKVSEYYDAVNFARFVKAPMLFILGFNDQVCCPTSTYSVYNQLKCEKKLLLPLECAHWEFDEQRLQQKEFLLEQLKK